MIVRIKKGGQITKPLPGDAGFDIHSEEDATIEPFSQKLISTNLYLEIPLGYVGIIKERSGLALKGVMIGAGVIDPNYRGEVKVLVRNFSKEPLEIKKGQRIAQILFLKYENPEFEEVEELSDSERGSGGFGSTGQ